MKRTSLSTLATLGVVGFSLLGAMTGGAALADDRTIKKQVAPEYPRGAERRGIEGYVLVEFNIKASGDIADVKIVESTPEGVFDEAVINAVSQWKYESAGADTVKQTKLSFKK